MKRVCKHVDISSRELITEAVFDCLHKSKKRQRSDTRRLFARLLHCSISKARKALTKRNELYLEGVELVVDMLRERIISRRLNLKPVFQQRRRDPSSGKIRKISILSIEQLLLDHVAVLAMRELTRRIGEYQVSSIKGRGAALGKKALERWMAKKSCKHAVKTDIKSFYDSVKRELLLGWLHKRVKNSQLLWLVGQLVYSVPQGIAIGSYLSQTLANLYLSELYHMVMERCISKRGKRQVHHALFYMDDMFMASNNKRQLRYAVDALIARAGELGLTIKRGWQVFKIAEERPVDMMGYRFSANCTTLRKHIFKRGRRALLRVGRAIRSGGRICLSRARKLASYYGYFKDTNCRAFLERVGASSIFKKAFNLIKQHDKPCIKHDMIPCLSL